MKNDQRLLEQAYITITEADYIETKDGPDFPAIRSIGGYGTAPHPLKDPRSIKIYTSSIMNSFVEDENAVECLDMLNSSIIPALQKLAAKQKDGTR